MIERLAIQNYAIIDSIELEFTQGFQVFTGETGAGKSIIIGALGLILGSRSDVTTVREGAGKAFVEAEFTVNDSITSQLRKMGIEEADTLIVRREVLANGKSRAFLNGVQTPITLLVELGRWLVDLHGQHDHQLLLDQKQHLGILDDFFQPKMELENYRVTYRRYFDLCRRYEELNGDEAKLEEERLFLESAIRELEANNLQKTEELEIENRIRQMENSEKISTVLNRVHQKLYEDELSVVSRLQSVVADLSEIAELNSNYAELLEILEDASAKVGESSALVSDYRDVLEYDEGEMNTLLDRRELIRDFKRKYRKQSVGELLDYLDSAKERLNGFENRNEELERIVAEREQTRQTLIEQARELSWVRQNAAQKLSVKIREELAYLGMEDAEFVVDIKYVRDENSEIRINEIPIRLSENGMDRVEFLIGNNRGQGVRPLRKVASGGEISRVMLAVKSVLAEKDAIETLVFDEIDTGIGGLTANHVGIKIQKLAEQKQLIVITHLAQIASKADRHLIVSKEESQGAVRTHVQIVEGEKRVEEIARMLGGESEASRTHAREMLNNVGK